MTNLAFAVAMALPAFAERALQVFRAFQRADTGIFLHEDEIFLAMIVPPAASATPVFHRTYRDSDQASNLYRHPALAMVKPPWPPRW